MSRRFSSPALTMTTTATRTQPSASSTASTPPGRRLDRVELSIPSPSQPPPPLPAHLSPHAMASIFSVAPPPSYPLQQQRPSLSSSHPPSLPTVPPRFNLQVGEGETGMTGGLSSSSLALTPHSRSSHPITPTHTTRPTPLLSAHRQEALLSTLLRMGFSASVSERALEGGGMESVEAAVERALQLVDEDEEAHRDAHQQEEDAAADAVSGISGAEPGESELKDAEADEASELPSKQPVTTTTTTDSPSARTRIANGAAAGISSNSGSSSRIAVTPPPLPNAAPPAQFQCETCTLLNPIAARRCEACGTRRPQPEVRLHTPRSLPLAYVEPAVQPVQEEPGAGPSSSPSSSPPSLPPNCGICFEHVAAAQLVPASCGHSFCQECWCGYLTSKVTDGHVLQLSCPFPQCSRSLSSAEVLALLPRPLHRKYDRFRTNAEIALDSNARWCPTVNCESVMIGSRDQPKLRCGKCRRSLCFNCNEAWHEGRSCEEAANSVMSQYKMSHDVKACPQCHTTIERSEGCNQ